MLAQAPPANLDQMVLRVMKEFEVPGVSLAIVKDGSIVVSKGYGLRKLGQTQKVESKTLFPIASNTKGFTATALALLVEQEKIEWDAPVIQYLPWFQLEDPNVTREISVRDLLVHRSGLALGAGDLLFWPPTGYSRKELVRRLRHVPLSTSFRSHYAYDNVLYPVAGEVIEAVSGLTWESFVQNRILRRVGMTRSSSRGSTLISDGNHASPHARINGIVRPVEAFFIDNVNPAGGINSCADDMAKWLLLLLREGELSDGSTLFSKRTARELWTIVTPIPTSNPEPELAALRSNFRGYALGFSVKDYRGRKMVTHTGGLPGFLSMVSSLPELELGVAVLINQESGAAFRAITYSILDYYLKFSDTDWVTSFKTTDTRRRATTRAAEQRIATNRNTRSRPSLPLSNYSNTYNDAWYGDISITLENRRLVIRFSKTPLLVGDLVHWQYDTFIAKWRNRELRADAFVSFNLTPEGTIDHAKMRAVSPATDFSFDFHHLNLKPSGTKSNE